MTKKELRKRIFDRVNHLDMDELEEISQFIEVKKLFKIGHIEFKYCNDEDMLYYRFLTDLSELHSNLSKIRELLARKKTFTKMLRQKGHDLEYGKKSIHFSCLLDGCLEVVMNLMYYDCVDRPCLDIRNGYRFTSGSVNFERFYFVSLESEE